MENHSRHEPIINPNQPALLMKAALDEISDAVLMTDEFGQTVYANKTFYSLYPIKEPLDSSLLKRALRGESFVQEYKFSGSYNEIGVVRYQFSPLRDHGGGITGVMVIGRDITQDKINYLKLRESENRARLLLEKSTEVIVGLDLNGKYLFVNQAYAKMLNRDADEIVGRSVRDVLPPDRAEERLNAIRVAVGNRQTKTNEFRVTDGFGKDRFYLTTSEPISDDHGNPQMVIFFGIDITERKLAELRLAESESKYRRLFEQNTDALVLFDGKTGEILDANPAAEILYGYSCKELSGLKVSNLAANPEDFMAAIKQAVTSGTFSTPQQNHRKKDGSLFPVEMTMSPFQLGDRLVMQPIIRDISERQRVQIRLEEISRRLQLATYSAKIGIWDWDIKSDTILWDDRMHELYGKPKELGIGQKGVNQWAELIHPDDSDRVFKECVAATQDKKNVYDTEFKVVHPDGSIRYLKAHGLVVWNDDGTAARMIGTNADITRQKETEAALRKAYSEIEATVKSRTTELTHESERLKESERRLKRAQELGRIGNWSTTIWDHQPEWSDEVYRIFGLEPQSLNPTRELFFSLILPEYRSEIEKVIDQAFESASSYEITFPFRRPDGSVGIAHSMAEVEFDKNNKPYKYSRVLQDVTEQKTLEKELRAAVELRDEFMSIASHELKTPLTALNMQLQLLERLMSYVDGAIDQRILKMSKGALNSVKSLSNLIDDLLDVTRIRAGKLTLSKEEIDLKVVLEKILSEMQPEAHRASTRIVLTDSESVRGEWDLARVGQVVRNLISNAIKYGKGSPVVVNLMHDKNDAWITVKDNGIGISKELQSQIFERFQRASSGNKITGLGLGLYIVRQIVEAHGGSIHVESEPNKGSLFTVKIPRSHI